MDNPDSTRKSIRIKLPTWLEVISQENFCICMGFLSIVRLHYYKMNVLHRFNEQTQEAPIT